MLTSPIEVDPGRVTVPVNVGEASGAFRPRAVSSPEILDVEISADALISSLIIVPLAILDDVTDPSKIIVEVTVPAGRVTVPVNVGDANGAFKLRAVVTVPAKLASSPSASANSFNVLRASGEALVSILTAASA